MQRSIAHNAVRYTHPQNNNDRSQRGVLYSQLDSERSQRMALLNNVTTIPHSALRYSKMQ